MSQQVASLYAEIGAKTDGFTTGAAKVKTDLTGLSSSVGKATSQFNGEFKTALLGGKANMEMFGNSLLSQAEKAGLSTTETRKLAQATGIYSDTQILAAQSSANVAAKAEELTQAVAKGEMTTREAGIAFKEYAATQEVAEAATISLQEAMMIGIPIVLGVAAALGTMEKAADEAARGDARLQAVITSTGEAAGYSFDQLDAMAQGLSHLTGIDDDVIKKSEAVALTFTNIGHDIFPQATQAALDLSAVLGTDLQGATIQVDKALNDFSGYTALKRAGVSFSEEQIKQIKQFKTANDLIGYQKLVLGELTKEFGGAAKAIHDAGDKSEDVAVAWGNLAETGGHRLLPVMRELNSWIASSIDDLSKDNKLQEIKEELLNQQGVTMNNLVAVTGKYGFATVQQMDAVTKQGLAILDTTSAAEGLAKAMGVATQANEAYVPSAEEVDRANKAISDANSAMVSSIQSMQDADEAYAKKSGDLTQERIDLQNKWQDALSKSGADANQINSDYQTKLDDIKQQEADLAAERDRQTLQFISNILLQKLEVDGFTTAEFDAFAKQQEAWGLWSADTVAKAQAAWQEADKVSASIDAIPSEKTSTITTVHVDTYGDGLIGPPVIPGQGGDGGQTEYNKRYGEGYTGQSLGGGDNVGNYGSFWDAPWNQYNGGSSWQQQYKMYGHASGGSFMVPTSYGNEGFKMGNGDTASGGELITITPQNRQNQGGQNFDYDRMARAVSLAVRDALMTMDRRS